MRFVAVHGHFYQPARENPWTGEVEREQSAAPYHDWNERITAECYAPNAAAGLLAPDGSNHATRNNYSHLSFNFGPTLLSWLARHAPATYAAVLAADRESCRRHRGHGPALAQMYSHTIAPLDTARDRRTQAIWAIRDFEHRFGRRPGGIWLAETAVDIPTLEALAGLGLGFTILAPRQAAAVRPRADEHWHDVRGGRVDTGQAYRCRLPSGASIALFFYDAGIAHDVAFGGLLNDGRAFADRLLRSFSGNSTRLVHIATDGETYGHHHRFGEMALAACLERIEASHARLTSYGAFLAAHPPVDEVRIVENTSWSCRHGVERWQADCGCATGTRPGWNQAWRQPLRRAMDWLRDRLAETYEREAGRFFSDPWEARDDYVSVLLDRSRLERFLSEHTRESWDSPRLPENRQAQSGTVPDFLIGLLEMQRFMMLALASDAWFFDDISELTTLQAMRCACRAMELCRELTGLDHEPEYLRILEPARSNIPELGTGADIYRRFARRGT